MTREDRHRRRRGGRRPASALGGIGQAIVKGLFGNSSTQPSQEALADIPGDYLALYQAAAAGLPGLDWSILAAIGKIESDHGRSPLAGVANGTENYAGARGPMQFLQSTFDSVTARHPLPPGGQKPPSPWNKHDAIYAAAYYLCDSGAQKDIRKAIWAYNHADWYVNDVLAQAEEVRRRHDRHRRLQQHPGAQPCCSQGNRVRLRPAGLALCLGRQRPETGWDCSGLATAAYQAAGIVIPRTTQPEYEAGPLVPAGQPLMPGDLVFYGTPPTSTTSACTSARERWCTLRPLGNPFKSARTAGAETTT